MIDQDVINKAITAHGIWKERLREAIETGHSEFSADKVSVDNGCEFGKWLYELSGDEAQSPIYSEVKSLHADFHKIASKILALAVSGNKEEAEKLISDTSGEYIRTSSKLILALGRWKRQ